jgi:hypothetical protein
MRILALIVALLGTMIFGTALLASYTNATAVETLGRELIRIEVERRVGEKVEALENSKIAALAARLSERNKAKIGQISRQLKDGFPKKVAAVVAEMRNLDCPCRKAIDATVTSLLEGQRYALSDLNERLATLIRTKYMEVAQSLTREFRIFTGANMVVFAALGFVTLARPRTNLHLVLPMIVLVGSAAIVAYFYLFEQNWFHTIVFSDYVGLAYFGYLGAAITWMLDIFFNRARITSAVINAVATAVGSAVNVSPC